MGTVRSIVLEPELLTAEAWAPFGWLPVGGHRPADVTFTYEFAWNDPHVNVISHAADEVEHTDDGSVCTVMYRHDTHTQTLLPLNVESVVAVAPADVDFSDPADLDDGPRVPARAARAASRSTAAPGTGARSRSATRRCACSTCRASATPRTTRAVSSPNGPVHVFEVVR